MKLTTQSARASWAALMLGASSVTAMTLDVTDPASIKQAAFVYAHGLMSYYQGNISGNTPGTLPGPPGTPHGYYWWEGGAVFSSLINYWYLTGDTTYNDLTMVALQTQVGEHEDFAPSNYTLQLGNDDQAMWGLASMLAAETKFPNPPADKPQWIPLTQAIVNEQIARWDTGTCGGGLRWQFNPVQAGYNYKNSISNACLFNLCARLARYTDNDTLADWAETVWTWEREIGLMDDDYNVFDGTSIDQNCTQQQHWQWSYSPAIFIYGAAVMWNRTQSDTWQGRLMGLLNRTQAVFSQNGVMWEPNCQNIAVCNSDNVSFLSFLSRYLAATTAVAPFTYNQIMPFLQKSAQAAAATCNGPTDGVTCGYDWTKGTYDGSYGMGQQMAALEVTQGLLIQNVAAPVTATTGGTNITDPNAGSDPNGISVSVPTYSAISTADRAGAGILTALCLIMTIGGGLWMTIMD